MIDLSRNSGVANGQPTQEDLLISFQQKLQLIRDGVPTKWETDS